MAHKPLRYVRVLEVVIPGFFALIGVVLLASGKPAGLVFVGFALLAVLAFEWRLRAHRRTLARVRGGLEEVGRRAFDAPVAVADRAPGEHVERVAANKMFASMLARRSARMFLHGRWQGRDVELGTAVIAARDFDQLVSYACVLDPRPLGSFRAMTRGAVSRVARIGMDKHPVATGDEAFDDAWVVDTDEATCRAVLDEGIRAKLVELRAQVPRLGVASIEATADGLVVRFPGELSAEWAANLRDLAFTLHDRLAARAA